MSTSFADELLDELDEAPYDDDESLQHEQRNGNDNVVDVKDDGRSSDVLVDADSADGGRRIDTDAQKTDDAGSFVAPSSEARVKDIEALDLRPESVQRIGDVCTLLSSEKMQTVLEGVDQYTQIDMADIDGVLEESPEYQLIVQANNLAADIDEEILIVHKFVRQHYKARFPELESIIENPWDFVQAVCAIGNQDSLANVKLDDILPHGAVVVISMQASTTKGRKLSAGAWQRIDEACKLLFALDDARRKILRYVESRMTMIAPNLSNVVGSRVATKLLGIAGGLLALTKIPANNVMLLGASNKALPGQSTAFSSRHKGFIGQAPMVERTPREYEKQAVRLVSGKAVLAARVDAGGSDRRGAYGARLAQELEKKLEKLQEPPPAKMVKALPVPKEGGKQNHRGGRRARKMKERLGMSDLRKMQNRVRFGQAEEEVGAFDETVGMGMIDSKGNTGRLRALAANNATKSRMSKRNTQRIQAVQQQESAARRLNELESNADMRGTRGTEVAGTASSITFTPVQGIELIDPSRQRKVDEANAKWFKEGTFSLAPRSSRTTALPGALQATAETTPAKKQRTD